MDESTSPTAQPGKDRASCLPCPSNSITWFYHPDRFFYNYPIKLSQKSWCNLWWTADIAKTARSCRFALHNIRKIIPFLTQHAAQLLVQALVISRLDYCNALLVGLPSCTIKPLQMIQDAEARLVFSKPKMVLSPWQFLGDTWKRSVTTVTSVPWRGNECCFRNAMGNALQCRSWSTCEINLRCNWDVRAGDVTNQEPIKPAQTKLSLA